MYQRARVPFLFSITVSIFSFFLLLFCFLVLYHTLTLFISRYIHIPLATQPPFYSVYFYFSFAV